MRERFLSYAQEYEDLMLYHVLRDVKQGFYIDIGANDPWDISVTKSFYERGWRGINIEPLPDMYDELVIDRNRDINCRTGAGRENGEMQLCVYGTGSSCDIRVIQHLPSKTTMTIPIKRLTDIINDHAKLMDPVIHFCKIDVEGFEKSVLEGIDFAVIRPWIFVIEAILPGGGTPCHEDWEAILIKAGYEFSFQYGSNRYYTETGRTALKNRFIKPTLLRMVYDVFRCTRVSRNLVTSDDVTNPTIYKTLLSADEIIFYGAGFNGKELLDLFTCVNLPLPKEIWDINANTLVNLGEVPVVYPRVMDERTKYADTIFIVTIGNPSIADEVTEKLSHLISPKEIFIYPETISSIVHSNCIL